MRPTQVNLKNQRTSSTLSRGGQVVLGINATSNLKTSDSKTRGISQNS
jgi:hypothetical protein